MMAAFSHNTMTIGNIVTDLMAQATAQLAAGDAEGALAMVRACLSSQPDDAHALQLCGIIERWFQRHAQAFALFGRAVRTAPGDAAIRRNHDAIVTGTLDQLAGLVDKEPLLAKILCDLLPQALVDERHITILERIRTSVPLPLLHQGAEHHRAGRYEEAATRYRAVLEIDPQHADALHLLGKIDHLQGDPLRGLQRIATAFDIGGLPPEAEHSLRACLQDLFQELNRAYTAQDFVALLELSSSIKAMGGRHLPTPHRDLMGAMLHNASFPLYNERGDQRLALACSEAAFALTPTTQIYEQLLLLRLSTRDYARAWNPKDWAFIHSSSPGVWDGSACGSLLVVNTNGLGDLLQFLRFLPHAVQRVGRVLLQVRPDVLPLVRLSPLVRNVTIVPTGTPAEADSQCELFSLPNILGLDPLRVPLPDPSFPLPADLVADWRRVVRRRERPHIGLVWSGWGPHDRRSVELAPLLPAIAGSEATFIALQNNAAKAELLKQPLPDNLQDFGVQGLLNLAAIMLACDLVVSVDCGLAHLACTLGMESWVLVQRHCDWRWHLEGEHCDWYPRARVFRQTEQGDWTGAIRALEDALRLRCSASEAATVTAAMPISVP
ncbi:tetratricopeptide repeat protein [Azospirillum sp. YIM B02556]|uniref:Tetratricopeptide repeat protein n=1 Tax=Azospirillum endophyticum TaxID=2800326 RepID=A0ABS1FBC4_9PROT|nr:tetratricopeptide repeat protein [Azospirillum endophyticum]MBK1840721.1 tetratricopeptide repeat protein [Azospirillum endophyticum]